MAMSKVAVDVLISIRIADDSAPIYGREILAGTSDEVPAELFADLEKAGYVVKAGAEHPRTDGPTIAEWVARGYPAANYPPAGYASQSSAAEIAEAVEAEKAKAAAGGGSSGDDDEAKRKAEEAAKLKEAMEAELAAMTVAQLKDLAKEENVTLTAEDNRKDEIIARIVESRLAAEEK